MKICTSPVLGIRVCSCRDDIYSVLMKEMVMIFIYEFEVEVEAAGMRHRKLSSRPLVALERVKLSSVHKQFHLK